MEDELRNDFLATDPGIDRLYRPLITGAVVLGLMGFLSGWIPLVATAIVLVLASPAVVLFFLAVARTSGRGERFFGIATIGLLVAGLLLAT